LVIPAVVTALKDRAISVELGETQFLNEPCAEGSVLKV
jgi:hypothetical protein